MLLQNILLQCRLLIELRLRLSLYLRLCLCLRLSLCLWLSLCLRLCLYLRLCRLLWCGSSSQIRTAISTERLVVGCRCITFRTILHNSSFHNYMHIRFS